MRQQLSLWIFLYLGSTGSVVFGADMFRRGTISGWSAVYSPSTPAYPVGMQIVMQLKQISKKEQL